MKSGLARSLARLAAATLPSIAATPAAGAQESTEQGTEPRTQVGNDTGLEPIIVTARRREENLQRVPVAVSAYSGESLLKGKVFTVSDLANSVPAFSITEFTPLDLELNIRGVDPRVSVVLAKYAN